MRFLSSLRLLTVFIALAMVSGCDAQKKAADQGKANTKTSNPAYNFSLQTMDGKKVSLADFKGKALIIDVWDTRCPPCRAEIPHFVDLYAKYNAKGLEILGVAGGRDGIDAVNRFIRDYGIKYPNAIATQEFIDGFGGIDSIPTTFVVDKKGSIVQKYVGLRPKSVFENDIKAILNL